MVFMMAFNKTRLLFIIAALLLVAAGCDHSRKSVEAEGRAVITVGSRTVSLKEYHDALKRVLPQDTADIESPDFSALKKDLLNQLVEEELILNEAGRLGITVSDEELSSEVNVIKKASGDDTFKDAITERYGDLESWKNEIKRKLLIRKTIDKVIGSKAASTEEAARRYYESHMKDYTAPEQVRARMIVVGSADTARGIKKRLTPRNFAKTASEVSLSPERELGGDLGFFGRGDMPKEFEDAVFKLKVGEISGVVKTEYGYHIFLLEERKKGGRLKFSEVKDKIMDKLRQDSTAKELSDWLAELKQTTKIEVKESLL